MPIVERAHQPRRWAGFRASRNQFAGLLSEIVRVVDKEAEGAISAEIEIEAYERPLRNKDEFLENVEEREWRDLQEINSEIRSGGDDGLRVSLSIFSYTGIRLTLPGSKPAIS